MSRLVHGNRGLRGILARPGAGLLILLAVVQANVAAAAPDEGLVLLTHAQLRVGIDRNRGGAITWISWREYPSNAVNIADPGRLIQQSYYAGSPLDRTPEGQSRSWSPWPWNPIQGGGVESWARVTELRQENGMRLYCETIPKLWDMPDEEAEARMRQWTRLDPSMPDVIEVRCEFESRRQENDRWGPPAPRAQEIPACYFTRNFEVVKSYVGNGEWRVESQPAGPPWGRAYPPLKAMALFTQDGRGVAVFSPAATQPWNFGPHTDTMSSDPSAGPCMHVAPIDRVSLGPRSIYRHRYWLIVGSESSMATRLDSLRDLHAADRAELVESPSEPQPIQSPPSP